MHCRLLSLVNLCFTFSQLGPVLILIARSCWHGFCLALGTAEACWVSAVFSIWPCPRMSTLQQRLLLSSPHTNYGLCILIPGALLHRNRGWSCLWLTSLSIVSPTQGVAICWSRATLHKDLLPESWIWDAPPGLSPPVEPWSREVGHTSNCLSPLLLFTFSLPNHHIGKDRLSPSLPGWLKYSVSYPSLPQRSLCLHFFKAVIVSGCTELENLLTNRQHT